METLTATGDSLVSAVPQLSGRASGSQGPAGQDHALRRSLTRTRLERKDCDVSHSVKNVQLECKHPG